jgi:TolB-like protein
MSNPPAAVFLSYASQDAAAAQNLGVQLRAAGVEVWFDRDELRGGDAWDAKIRRQIQECALFVPVVSVNTQARPEGYFRLEWKLAVDRSHLMSDDHPFLFPVVIDDTAEATARVPDRFRERHWLRVPGGRADAALVAQVQRLLAGQTVAGRPGPSRPRAVRPKVRGWLGLAGLLLAVGGGWLALRWHAPGPAPAPAVAAGSKSIAVLPFTNMSEDRHNAVFADGVQEDILTGLALVGDLQVISRTSVMGYRDTTKPIQQIGRELGVAYILEGSVRRIGNKVRVTGQLINAANDQHLWARTYDRELDDIFAIQTELAKDIAGALHAVLTPEDVGRLEARPTDSIEAYDLYLQARAAWGGGEGTPEMLARMQPLLERAVQLDPRFALAWLELANVHWRAHDYLDRTDARRARAEAAFGAAERLAPDNLEVIMARAAYLRSIGDGAGHATVMQRLLRLYPNHPAVLLRLAQEASDPHEKLDYYQRARRLDPRNPELLDSLSDFLLGGRRYDEAFALATEANALGPVSPLRAAHAALIPFLARGATGPMETCLAQIPAGTRRTDPGAIMAQANWAYITGDTVGLIRLWEESGAHWRFAPETARFDTIVVAQALLIRGERDRARTLLEKNRGQLTAELARDPDNFRKWADLALIQAMLGNKPDALVAEAKARQLAFWMSFAMIDAWNGDKEAALAELARTVPGSGNFHEANVHVLRHQLGLWPLQGDPRFAAILDDPKSNTPLF